MGLHHAFWFDHPANPTVMVGATFQILTFII
jgi:hypothetical protein